jgi:elongation factor G
MEQRNNRTVVHATAPQAEVMRYGTDLRSMTQGRGVYAMSFSHYEPVPAHMAQAVIEAHKKEAAGEEH